MNRFCRRCILVLLSSIVFCPTLSLAKDITVSGLSNAKTFQNKWPGNFYIQVGSFSTASHAYQLKKSLELKSHYPISISAVSSYFIVKIGPLHSAAEVRELGYLLSASSPDGQPLKYPRQLQKHQNIQAVTTRYPSQKKDDGWFFKRKSATQQQPCVSNRPQRQVRYSKTKRHDRCAFIDQDGWIVDGVFQEPLDEKNNIGFRPTKARGGQTNTQAHPIKVLPTQSRQIPIFSWFKQRPIPSRVKPTPVPSRVKQTPIPSRVKQTPILSWIKQIPILGWIKQTPVPSRVKQIPIPSRVKQTPIPSRVARPRQSQRPAFLMPDKDAALQHGNWFVGIDGGVEIVSVENNIPAINSLQLPPPYDLDSYSTTNPTTGSVAVEGGYRWQSGKEFLPVYSLGVRYKHLFLGQVGQQIAIFALPEMTDYNYNWNVSSDTFLVTAKLNIYRWGRLMPYINGGVGAAFNHTSGYNERAKSGIVPRVSPNFGNNTYSEFTAMIGAGLDWSINSKLLVSLGYEYQNLGRISSGTGAGYWSGTSLNSDTYQSNGVVFGFKYLF